MSTGSYRNRVRKSVHVKSNDPERPSTYIHVEAFVKPDISFETATLSLDNVLASQKTFRETYINLAGFTGVTIDSIVSTSPLVSAELGEAPDTMENDQRVKLDVAIGPGLEPGLLSESITVFFGGGRPSIQLYLYGIIVEDIQVTPLALVYVIPESTADGSWPKSRTLKVTSNLENLDLELLKVSDPAGLLDYRVTEIEPNKTFQITATLKPIELAHEASVASQVNITTNHDVQKTIKIPVRVEHQ